LTLYRDVLCAIDQRLTPNREEHLFKRVRHVGILSDAPPA
jgi:hypothetical protein